MRVPARWGVLVELMTAPAPKTPAVLARQVGAGSEDLIHSALRLDGCASGLLDVE